MSDIVHKLWGFCHTLRHDGVDYGDYIEQLTYLLFLKMADERGADVPKGCDWKSLKEFSGTALTDHYADTRRRRVRGSRRWDTKSWNACVLEGQHPVVFVRRHQGRQGFRI